MSIDKRISEFDIIEEFDITTKIPIIQGSPLKNGIITPKDFTKSIADDMLIELSLDNVDNTSDTDKPISTATKTYVDNKVKTDVPAGAKFTDTIYTHPATHPASMITESTTKRFVTDAEKSTWTNKETPEGAQTKATKALTDAAAYVNTKVKTNVPVGAKFTDTIVDISGKADITYVENKVKTNVPVGAKFTDTNTITTINGKTGVISKADIVALGIPAQDTIVDISGKADITYVDEEIAILESRPLPNPMVTLTEVEYNSLSPKDPNTYYFIKED